MNKKKLAKLTTSIITVFIFSFLNNSCGTNSERYEFKSNDRDTVVLWMTKITGGNGHFGIDLILDDGINPCTQAKWRKYCCSRTYYRCPSFGPDTNEIQHGVWVRNSEDDGTVTNFAKRLRRADIEIYSRRLDNQGRLEYMSLRTHVSSFNHRAHGRHYSSHIGEVVLPKINYDQPNFGSLHGLIMKDGRSIDGYRLEVILFGQGNHVQSSKGHPMQGFKVAGNIDGNSYYNTGPIPKGRYDVRLKLHTPDGRSKQIRDFININRPNIPVTIRIENFFPEGVN